MSEPRNISNMSADEGLIPNWCSTVDSPTYKLTLYLAHVDSWATIEQEIAAGKKEGPTYAIMAESGKYSDVVVDNLLLQSVMIPDGDYSNAATQSMQFSIYEPGGFNLLDKVAEYSEKFKFSTFADARWILRIEFLGRNSKTGRAELYGQSRFFSIVFDDINANTSEAGTTYNIIASNIVKSALRSTKVGTSLLIDKVTTFNSLLDNMSVELNKHEQKMRKQTPEDGTVNIHTTWNINYDNVPNEMLAGEMDGLKSGNPTNGVMVSNLHPDTLSYTISPGDNIVTYLTDISTKSLAAYYKTISKTNDSSKHMIVAIPTIAISPDIDKHTNKNKEIITITLMMRETFMPDISSDMKESKSDQEHRLSLMQIQKRYEPLFSAYDTEVLDYNIQINNLFRRVLPPSGGNTPDGISDTDTGTVRPVIVASPHEQRLMTPSPTAIRPGTSLSVVRSNEVSNLTTADQTGVTDKDALIAMHEYRVMSGNTDMMVLEMKVKGDPYYLTTQVGIEGNYGKGVVPMNKDVMIAIVSYLPQDLTTVNPTRRLDYVGTGVYRVNAVDHRLQKGEFIQTLHGVKDSNTTVPLVIEHIKKWKYNG